MNSKFIALFSLALLGCGQDYNSNTNDQGQYASVTIDSSTPDGTRFSSAYKILQSKCMQCHDWTSYNTSEKWISTGYVSQGNFSDSTIITALKNYGGQMPKDPYTALSDTEVATLREWISNL